MAATASATTSPAFSSRLGFILSSAGSAIGLGCIWKFPYMAAQNGGSAFFMVYLLLAMTLGLALMSVEMALGRASGSGVAGAFLKLGGPRWRWLGRLPMITAFIIMGFYCVVGGWSLAYLFKSLLGQVVSNDAGLLADRFSALISNPWQAIAWHAGFLGLSAFIVLGGVQQGIEKMSRWLMPMLFILMLVLIVRGVTLPGAMAGVEFLLVPDFSKLGFDTVLAALGLAFFSLSLGMGAMVTYGAYLDAGSDLPASAGWVVALTLVACLLGGLLVIPPAFAMGLDPQSGPGLTFISMPSIFAHMPAGDLFAALFFALLLVAALTSSVSLLEVCARFAIDEFGMSRRRAVLGFTLGMFLVGIPAALSFGVWKDATLFGRNAFDLMDYATSNVMLPVSGIATAILGGWFCWRTVASQMRQRAGSRRVLLAVGRVIVAMVAPVAIAVILVRGV
ncbi:sodium-dependent transporter [Uliginosibacterium sp. H1]|uniref:sodium-dependent transporter n=1 Tax=Uliginosibacterium sp. H1 TaxID=3114757 RepID=UPI002E19C8C8|nr:sodium-dependent transporter [Uliginosibacterium sp. H1]